ncbi:MAG: glycosyltransferase [Elusimicrobiota bacterium]
MPVIFVILKILVVNCMLNKIESHPKKVLMLVDGLDITNGVSVTCKEIAKNWHKVSNKWELLIYGTSVRSLDDEKYDGACIRVDRSLIQIPVLGYKRMWLSIPLVELFKLFSSSDYCIVHSATPGPIGVLGSIAACILHKPLVMTHHTRMVDYMKYYAPRGLRTIITLVAKFLFRKFYSLGTRTVAHSPATIDELKDLGAKVIDYLPMGVPIPYNDIDKLIGDRKRARERICRTFDIPENKKIIMYIGRIAKEKNLNYFADVSDRMDHKFIIVGDGPVKKSLEKYPNLILPGFRYGNELAEMYLGSDLFLCTSVSETLGKTLLEALSYGTPILVPDKGYHNSIIKEEGPAVHKYRWGIQQRAVNNIVDSINTIIEEVSDNPEVTKTALEYAMQFSWENLIVEYADPYEKIFPDSNS